MKERRSFTLMILLVAMSLMAGCQGRCSCTSAEISIGSVGIRVTPHGKSEEILNPGYHWIFGRDKLYIVPTRTISTSDNLSIRLINGQAVGIPYQVVYRIKVAGADVKKLSSVIADNKVHGSGAIRGIDQREIFRKTVEPAIKDVVRNHVSRYKVYGILKERQKIAMAIRKGLRNRYKTTYIQLQSFTIGDIKVPRIVKQKINQSAAQDEEMKRRESIERGKKRILALRAQREMMKLRLEKKISTGRIALAALKAKEYVVYERVLRQSFPKWHQYVTFRRLELREQALKNQKILYSRRGGNVNLVLMQGKQNFTPLMQIPNGKSQRSTMKQASLR